ncbi:hypothetical protein [Peristeroidobacter soli]|jgi:hypothetical protein|uniref:hypothetical protein n=1 Tax=Peristeroidobacter soli TaxID=2497877 RepID=UPI0013007560|nr:hypothetical protein [Peristeroidobacter soli]
MTGGSGRGQETESLRQLTEVVRTESSDGARLVANIADNPICRITVDAGIPCVMLVWGRYATSSQLRFVHECALDLLRRHALHKILGDDSSLAVITVDDQGWLREDWFPRALKAGLKATASKCPNGFFGKQSVANVMSGAPAGVTLRSFEQLEEAKAWLQTVPI